MSPRSELTPAAVYPKEPNGWTSGGAAGNFVKDQVMPVTVPGAVAGHVFHYEGRLVSVDNQVISFGESSRFILV